MFRLNTILYGEVVVEHREQSVSIDEAVFASHFRIEVRNR